GVDLGIFDAMPGLPVDLVEADLFGIRCRRIEGNRTGHERKAQEALPVGAGGHGILRNATDNQLDSICTSAFKASRARNLVIRLLGSGGTYSPIRLCWDAPAAAGFPKPEHRPGWCVGSEATLQGPASVPRVFPKGSRALWSRDRIGRSSKPRPKHARLNPAGRCS